MPVLGFWPPMSEPATSQCDNMLRSCQLKHSESGVSFPCKFFKNILKVVLPFHVNFAKYTYVKIAYTNSCLSVTTINNGFVITSNPLKPSIGVIFLLIFLFCNFSTPSRVDYVFTLLVIVHSISSSCNFFGCSIHSSLRVCRSNSNP